MVEVTLTHTHRCKNCHAISAHRRTTSQRCWFSGYCTACEDMLEQEWRAENARDAALYGDSDPNLILA